MTTSPEHDSSLPAWASQLLSSLELSQPTIDLAQLRDLTSAVAAAPSVDDALLLGFIAGYAAGRAEGEGMASFERAHTASVRFMRNSLLGE